MIKEMEATADFLPIWMLLSAAFGFMIGDAFGDSGRHRKCLEETNADLREQLEIARVCQKSADVALKHHRAVIHDIHKHVVAISKAIQKPPS